LSTPMQFEEKWRRYGQICEKGGADVDGKKRGREKRRKKKKKGDPLR